MTLGTLGYQGGVPLVCMGVHFPPPKLKYQCRVEDDGETSGSNAADDMDVDEVEDSSDEEPEPSTRKRGVGRLQVLASALAQHQRPLGRNLVDPVLSDHIALVSHHDSDGRGRGEIFPFTLRMCGGAVCLAPREREQKGEKIEV